MHRYKFSEISCFSLKLSSYIMEKSRKEFTQNFKLQDTVGMVRKNWKYHSNVSGDNLLSKTLAVCLLVGFCSRYGMKRILFPDSGCLLTKIINQKIREKLFTPYRTVGTAAMGTVLDSQLRVKGKHVYLIDLWPSFAVDFWWWIVKCHIM